MHLTGHGHACVRVDHGDARIVLDPGAFSATDAALSHATVALITHEHPDHLAVEPLVHALAARHDLQVWTTAAGRDQVIQAGGDRTRVHVADPGAHIDLDGVRVHVGGQDHAVIHPQIPVIDNRTYTIEAAGSTVHHPGDSFDLPATGVDVQLLPVAAPWMRLADAMDAAASASARFVVPVHDAILSDRGRALVDRLLDTARVGGDYEYRRLAAGESWWP